MFAILIYERELLKWSGVPAAVEAWVQDAGLFAALALVIWLLAYGIRKLGGAPKPPAGTEGAEGWTPKTVLFTACLAGSLLSYALLGLDVAFFQGTVPQTVLGDFGKSAVVPTLTPEENIMFTAGGGFALAAILVPILFSLSRLRGRRIWALAKLSMKETIRHRILWVFSFLLLVVLFASWFINPERPEFMLRNYVWVVDWSTTILVLLAASLLAAFSIPTDVKSQTIHTVVTKPVERFEIVLGRFLGYTLLLTGVLLVATALGLVYLFRNVAHSNEAAKKQDYTARVPIYAQTMGFRGTQGENAGREWTHRRYIWGPHRGAPPTQFAVWEFEDVPARLADRPEGVRCEFSFDIYRTHKGPEGKGIFCTFLFATRNCPVRTNSRGLPELDSSLKAEMDQRRKQLRRTLSPQAADLQVVKEYGLYEVPSVEVTNYRTQAITLPVELFQNLRDGKRREEPFSLGGTAANPPDLQIIFNVRRNSPDQLVGVAPTDLYLLDREKSFEENYFKAAFGLWCRLCLLVGIAVACGTYLSGIIAFLCTWFFFGLGLFKVDIQKMVLGLGDTGGPLESLIKVASGKPVAYQLDQSSSTIQVAQMFDQGFRWVMGQILKLVPDVNRYDLSRYVTNGFNISVSNVLAVDNLLPMLAYLVPCLIFAYYLIKYREVANPS